jgi:hypothetical protein
MNNKNNINNSSSDNKSSLQCKIIGVLTFVGTAGYAGYLRMNTPIHSKGQRIYLGCVGIGSVAVALWRMSID